MLASDDDGAVPECTGATHHHCVTGRHAQIVELLFVPNRIVVNLSAKQNGDEEQQNKHVGAATTIWQSQFITQ